MFNYQIHVEERNHLLLDEEKLPTLKRAQKSWVGIVYLTISLTLLAFEIANTVMIYHRGSCLETEGYQLSSDLNGIVPSVSTTHVMFEYSTEDWVPGPNDSYVPAHIWENWTALLPVGNGVVSIANYEDFRYLTQPIQQPENFDTNARFSTAWAHELHCLFFIMKEYHRVLHHGPDGTEYFIDPTHNSYHASHCFNYLRQAILCSLDSTLEGAGEGSGAADGSGQTHVCKDRKEAITWLESKRIDDTHAIDII